MPKLSSQVIVARPCACLFTCETFGRATDRGVPPAFTRERDVLRRQKYERFMLSMARQ